MLIVGIGASAGGIQSLELILPTLGGDGSAAYIIAMHQDAHRHSLLTEVLARSAKLPIATVADGDELQADHIYVMPPGQDLRLSNGRCRLTDIQPGRRYPARSIDNFFAALAEDAAERVVVVILSGAGSDGTLGAKAVKESGGLTIAQGGDGNAPQFSGMPNSAISSKLIDLVLTAEEIPGKLREYAASFVTLNTLVRDDDAAKQLEKHHLAICRILRNHVGHDFTGYKGKTFMRRVQRRMQVLQLERVSDYLAVLGEQAAEADLLFRDLLIGVTDFFRDTDAFAALQADVIPRLFDGRGANETLRVWVPGCATGEEAYSIAILLREHMDRLSTRPRVQIFATDLDDEALTSARNGRYPAALLGAVDAARLDRHFLRDGDSYVVRKEVRDLCVFSAHSLVRDPPFSRIDLVSCRNLLIYFGVELQSQVIPVFHYALRPAGVLFLGIAESLGMHQHLFAPVDKKHRIFRRRDIPGPRPPLSMFLGTDRGPARSGPPATPPNYDASFRRMIETHVLEQFTPPHVVVNAEGEVVYYSPRTGKYLEPPAGAPNRNLLAMARKGLRLELRNALGEATRLGEPVERERLMVESLDRVQIVSLRVQPLQNLAGEPLFLVLFSDVGPPKLPGEVHAAGEVPDGRHSSAAEAIERELHETKERLQNTSEEFETAIEELRAANEELVSVNEELQSTNEELETSKEEMQSLNEELQTVNVELSRKVEELDQANADLRNLFDSTEIATVFLDRELHIRSFTQAITGVFNLIASDRGRPLTDIVHQLGYDALADDLAQVKATGERSERHVVRRDGTAHYLMRMLPYRVDDDGDGDGFDGIVVTFVDVTEIKQAEQHQRQLVIELNHRVKNMLGVLMSLATQTLGEKSRELPFRSFLDRLQALARSYELVTDAHWGDVSLRESLLGELMPHVVGPDRLRMDGPDLLLPARFTLTLAMVMHELVTNAVKHGALSVPDGRIDLTWQVEPGQGDDTDLVLEWRENDGPAVAPPAHRGLGRKLIENQLSYEFGGRTQLDFLPDGVRATLRVPRPQPTPGAAQ